MDALHQALDVFLHLDQHLNQWAEVFGPWLYVLLFVIVFCETGLVVTPFLPGDSLMFAVGALAATPDTPLVLPFVMAVLGGAAVLGDASNYAIGRYLGPQVFTSERSRIFNPKHLERTHEFYERYGGKTIFLARFVPIVRTFAPFVAGVGRMTYGHFAWWNVTGAGVWVVSLTLAGYWFGRIPIVQRNFEAVILGIIFVSLLPMVVELLRERRRRAAPTA
ncbi:MAG TPA: DedA family protein [Myxococcota bacterium]|jgi:membrane-associated protein|nr:DedA family protein [Myxococcota bacterium]